MPGAFTLHESSPQHPKHSPLPGCDARIRQALCQNPLHFVRGKRLRRTSCPPRLNNGAMGEVILLLPDGGTQENLLPVAGRVLVAVLPGYKHPVLDRLLTQGERCAAGKRNGGVTDIESRLLASDCIPMCKMRLQSEAAKSIPTNRSCRFCDPVSGRCRGLCVRPCSPKPGRETLQRHYRTMSFAQVPSRPTT